MWWIVACVGEKEDVGAGADTGTRESAEDSAATDDTAGDIDGDTAGDSAANTAMEPPCDWAALPRPHWSLGLPWILLDPSTFDEDPYADLGSATQTDAGAEFLVQLTPADSAYADVTYAGTFDLGTGVGAWTLTWTSLDGVTGSRDVEAEWEGCTLVERFDAAAPWLDVTDSSAPSTVASERRTSFGADGTAFSVGVGVDGDFESCVGDNLLEWSNVLAPDGTLSGSGTLRRGDDMRHDRAWWSLDGSATGPWLELALSRGYAICCCSVGAGGDSTTLVEVAASSTSISWSLWQSWDLYDRDLGWWTEVGAGEAAGRSTWDGTATLTLHATETSWARETGTTEATTFCDGTWTTDAGLAWDCEDPPSTAGLATWSAPPTIAAWGL